MFGNKTLKNRINFLEIKLNDKKLENTFYSGKIDRLERELAEERTKNAHLENDKKGLEELVRKLENSLNNIPKERVIELATDILLQEGKDIERDSLKKQITSALTIRPNEPQPEGGMPLV